MQYINASRVAQEKKLGMLDFNTKKQRVEKNEALAKAEKLHGVNKHYPCRSTTNTNNINVVDSFTVQISTVNMTTSIIITTLALQACLHWHYFCCVLHIKKEPNKYQLFMKIVYFIYIKFIMQARHN